MFFKRVDIEEVLIKEKLKSGSKTDLLAFTQKIIDNIEHSNQFTAVNKLYLDKLDSNAIYHISEIKKICIEYRLRFLDKSYYKLNLPNEAIEKIEVLNNIHKTNLHSLMIIAPAKSLKLENYDDPLLFAPIGNDYYYLIHKWGNDLHPLRKWFSWAMKNLSNLVTIIFLISLLTTIVIPIKKFDNTNSSSAALITFLFVFKSYCGIILYFFIWKGKQFSTYNWNSKYYN